MPSATTLHYTLHATICLRADYRLPFLRRLASGPGCGTRGFARRLYCTGDARGVHVVASTTGGGGGSAAHVSGRCTS